MTEMVHPAPLAPASPSSDDYFNEFPKIIENAIQRDDGTTPLCKGKDKKTE